MSQGIDAFFGESDMHGLTHEDWEEIEMMGRVLEVCVYCLLLILY